MKNFSDWLSNEIETRQMVVLQLKTGVFPSRSADSGYANKKAPARVGGGFW